MRTLNMDPTLEIRKLGGSNIRELEKTLEAQEQWKGLMKNIPKVLSKSSFQCDITDPNQRKYNSEDFRLIESESKKSGRSCTEILFDEWGTSGKIRPALGHLLYLLVKAKLFRAADYVAVDLLHQEKPKRPDIGPEAEISLPEIPQTVESKDGEFEKVLDEINYVANAVELIRTYSDKIPRRVSRVPRIVVTPDIEENDIGCKTPPFNVPVVVERTRPVVVERTRPLEDSDLMKFTDTATQPSEQIPVVVNDMNNSDPQLISVSRSSVSSNLTSSVSNETASTESSEHTTKSASIISSDFNPAISELMDLPAQSDTTANQNIPEDNPAIRNVPDLTILNLEPDSSSDGTRSLVSESYIPDFGILNAQDDESTKHSSNLPNLSALHSGTINNISIGVTGVLPLSNTSQPTSTRSCPSPLPNIPLDTSLPHVTYQILEAATNNFNPEHYKGQSSTGRFLGKGEFGSVFLALNLTNKPLAVKKLDIGDVEIVNIDDEVTKQFRNEVEVLSKYKHENLLSLLGYSCDGSTYCLLYEYVPRGTLKDRLQDTNCQLFWKQRMHIAVGTSRAISYLHTAFSTPLIHRDVKSANILLDSTNQPKLCDFGLIKLIPNQNANTATTVYGTSAYMPREAFGGDISVKLDTFSFGVVLLELLTSLPPIDDTREGVDLVSHVSGTIENNDITPLVDYKAGSWLENATNYAAKLYEVAQSSLREQKKKRPTMLEVKDALEDIISFQI